MVTRLATRMVRRSKQVKIRGQGREFGLTTQFQIFCVFSTSGRFRQQRQLPDSNFYSVIEDKSFASPNYRRNVQKFLTHFSTKICTEFPFSFTIFGGFLKKASLFGGAFVLKKPEPQPESRFGFRYGINAEQPIDRLDTSKGLFWAFL